MECSHLRVSGAKYGEIVGVLVYHKNVLVSRTLEQKNQVLANKSSSSQYGYCGFIHSLDSPIRPPAW
jgi:hypothetical protein